MKATSVRLALALAAALAAAATAHAEPIYGTGVVSSYTGSFSYGASDSTHATLVVSLTNTTALPLGRLTGFAFDNPGNKITGASVSSSNPDFHLLGGPTFQDGVPVVSLVPFSFGLFDLGASTGTTIYGSPNKGLTPGQSATFTVSLTGTGLGGLSTASFFATDSAPIGNLPQLHGPFVANFQYFNVLPDVAPGHLDDRVHPDQLPEPDGAVLAAVGAAFAGAVGWRRYRRGRAADAAA